MYRALTGPSGSSSLGGPGTWWAAWPQAARQVAAELRDLASSSRRPGLTMKRALTSVNHRRPPTVESLEGLKKAVKRPFSCLRLQGRAEASPEPSDGSPTARRFRG